MEKIIAHPWSKSTDTPVRHLVDFMGGNFLISVHTSSFGNILLLNLYGGTKKIDFSRDRSSSDRSCLLLVRIAVQPGLYVYFERSKFE